MLRIINMKNNFSKIKIKTKNYKLKNILKNMNSKTKKDFLILSLEDKKTKQIANIVTNLTCKKILNYLLENKNSTQTKISSDLKIPAPTVFYNLEKLVKAKLIISKNSHYSQKGKEIKTYSIANKFIIIVPKNQKTKILEQLKNLIPVFLIIGIFSYLINFFEKISNKENLQLSAKSYKIARELPIENNMQNPLISTLIENKAFWFLLGSIIAIIIYFITNQIFNKIKK